MSLNGWSLEVVRGREIGRAFAIEGSETVLGNTLNGSKGIDLGTQESESPRRMAARQAMVERTASGLSLRDLDSPGGTFVNRQRILPGQTRPLVPDDLIQLGSVQLRVVKGEVSRPVAVTPHAAFPYTFANGSSCGSWDDFLRVGSQKWADLRDELQSGRIDTWLRSLNRNDLIKPSGSYASTDERLDAWLGGLPTSLPAKAELDVHPKRLVIRIVPGGGTTARSVHVANVGLRLLRIRAKIEPTATTWVKVTDPVSNQSRTVIESFDLPIEVTIPETLPRPLSAFLVVESNGGEARVELFLEAKSLAEPITGQSLAGTPSGPGVLDRFGALSILHRCLLFALAGFLLRIVVGLAGGTLGEDGMQASGAETPGLIGPSIILGVAVGLLAAWMAARRGGRGQGVFGFVSGSVVGAAVAAIVVATCRAIEPLLGGLAGSILGVSVLWTAVGVGLAGLSRFVVPVRSIKESQK